MNNTDQGLARTYAGLKAPGYTADRVFDYNRNMYTSKYKPTNQASMLDMQTAEFGTEGINLTNQGLNLGASRNKTPSYWDSLKAFETDTAGMDSGTGLNLSTDPSQPWYKNETAVGLGLGAANIGLGFASFLENKKTGKLQREGMRHDLSQARNDAARQQAQIDYVKQRGQDSSVV